MLNNWWNIATNFQSFQSSLKTQYRAVLFWGFFAFFLHSVHNKELFEWDIMPILWEFFLLMYFKLTEHRGDVAQLSIQLIKQKESLMKFLWSAFSRSPCKYILMKFNLSGLEGAGEDYFALHYKYSLLKIWLIYTVCVKRINTLKWLS